MAVDVSVQVEVIAAGTSVLILVVTRVLDYFLPPVRQRPSRSDPDPTQMGHPGSAGYDPLHPPIHLAPDPGQPPHSKDADPHA